ncbi:MAG TPA: class E sortase [Candidatus Saccharimonadales bacterium]|nr:class E sortase [Candidatus Saccharimonadales bacterium]
MSFSRANKLLLAGIIVINLYIIGLPLYSLSVFWWQKHIEHQPAKLAQVIKSLPAKSTSGKYSTGEHLLIPSIALDENIIEGSDASALNRGIWHWPKSARPGQVGNTVLIGHRWIYVYNGDVAFEHLDLVKKGDNITVIWDGQKFSYTVTGVKVVKPSDTSIIRPTTDKRLTLYTCTPMWTDKYRLVVTAEEDQT